MSQQPTQTDTLIFAEVRAYINNHSSIDPARVKGLHGTYVFLRDRATAKMLRRYVPGGGDENAGAWPLANFATEMKDMALSRRSHFQVVWEFLTPEQVAEGVRKAAADEKQMEQAAKLVREEREAQQRVLAETQATLQRLTEPGYTAPVSVDPEPGKVDGMDGMDKMDEAPAPEPKVAKPKAVAKPKPAALKNLEKLAGAVGGQ